jgi:DNA polymerase III subunit beta
LKLEVTKRDLFDVLSKAVKVVPSRTTMPILSHVLLSVGDGLFVSSTDIDRGLVLRCNAQVSESGEVTTPARKLVDFVATLPDDVVKLRVDGEKLRVSCGKAKASFPTLPADEFPSIEDSRVGVSLIADELSAALDHVLFCAGSDSSHPVLEGVWVQSEGKDLWLSSADGFRMARTCIRTVEDETEIDMIIPAATLSLVASLDQSGDLVFGKREHGIGLTISDGVNHLSGSVIDGQFPDVARIIPAQTATNVTVSKDLLSRAVKQALIFSRDVANIVVLDINESGVIVSGDGGESSGVSEVQAMVDGEPLEIAFNGRFLDEALRAAATDEVYLGVNQPTTPGLIKEVGGDDDWMHVLMPMHIKGR